MKIETKQKIREIKAKVLRALGITKPIQLDNYEIKWIKLCKGHYKEKYPSTDSWVKTLKPLFVEIYGWNPDQDKNYHDYLNCIFGKLLEIHLKIVYDQSGSNLQLREIFNSSFSKSFWQEEELPIERAIAQLCNTIHGNLVIENGVHRYYL